MEHNSHVVREISRERMKQNGEHFPVPAAVS